MKSLGCLDPRGVVLGSDISRLFPGVWSMLIYFMAILGVSEAASRINIALVSFTFFRAATNVNGEYSSEI